MNRALKSHWRKDKKNFQLNTYKNKKFIEIYPTYNEIKNKQYRESFYDKNRKYY
jgi:hypothetical protein